MPGPGVLADGFGDLLRGFRIRASLTQEALAEWCRISPATIAALEQGRRTAPRLSTVRLIAGALELPPGDVALLARAASDSGRANGQPPEAASGAAAHRSAAASQASHPRLPVPLTPLFGRHARSGIPMRCPAPRSVRWGPASSPRFLSGSNSRRRSPVAARCW